jgi:cytochrome c
MSELEKVVIALATAIIIFIFSDNLGRLIYGPNNYVSKQGYVIKVEDSNRTTASAPTGLPEVLDMQAIMSAADVATGQGVFKKVCTLCHNGDKGGPNKVGPNLWNIFNNTAAHKEDFNYSQAMLARKATGVRWDEEQLYRYLFAPKQYVVGTKMSFIGIKDDKERADLVAYLKTLRDE